MKNDYRGNGFTNAKWEAALRLMRLKIFCKKKSDSMAPTTPVRGIRTDVK